MPAESTDHAPAEGVEPAPPEPEPTTNAESEVDEPKEPSEQPAPAAADNSDTAPRELKYVVTPQGLQIRVEGVEFLANATPTKTGGGWGVKVKVTAQAKDDKSHQLLTPRRGPLAFAGSIERNGQAQRFGDKREGDESEPVVSASSEFTREWPGDSGEKAAKQGDKLVLEVGLWGLGESDDKLRPVKQFFTVKMSVGKGKPQAVVEPPAAFTSGGA